MRGLPRAPPEPACICATHLTVLTAPAGGLRTMEVRHRDAKQRARGHTGARGGEGRHRQRVRPAPQRSPGTCPPSAVWEVPDPAVASPAAPSGPLTRRRRTACGAPGPVLIRAHPPQQRRGRGGRAGPAPCPWTAGPRAPARSRNPGEGVLLLFPSTGGELEPQGSDIQVRVARGVSGRPPTQTEQPALRASP